ncbi:MAG: sigma-70 family RNA polymerase sigma factor [Candidatus Aminicenantales bacterium]
MKPLDIIQLYDRFGEAMYRYLSVKLGSPDDAEDVLQEVFYRLGKSSFRLRFVRDLRAFSFRVARNEANRWLRRKIRNEQTAASTIVFAESFRRTYASPEDGTHWAIADALAQIPEGQREVIILKILEGLTFREIAAANGESTNTMASRYRYGIEKLRMILEDRR